MNKPNDENFSEEKLGAQSEKAMEINGKKQLVGVGGWLLLFCIGLVILNPLLRVGGTLKGYIESKQYFDQMQSLKVIMNIELVLAILFSLFSVYAGLMLYWKLPNAVKITKFFLLATLAMSLIEAVFYSVGLSSESLRAIFPDISKDVFRSLLYVGVWYSYLNKSVRVRNTYMGV